jgi:putative ABC transport system ATP-binding protein
METSAIELRGVSHTFGRGGPNEVTALDGVDLTLEPGSFVVVFGPNGSGKSTLLSVVAGDFIPDSGSIRVGGIDVTHRPAHDRAHVIGRVSQDPSLGTAPSLTVAENLALAGQRATSRRDLRAALSPRRRRELADRVAGLRMGLEDRLDTPMAQLSGGQRQALTLLMATLVRPEVLLLDEHLAALDPRSAEDVLRLTKELIERDRLTVLMVSHSMQQVVRLGDRAVMIHRGRTVQDFSGARKRRLRVDELLDCFEAVRNADLLDDTAAAMLARSYV